MKAHAHGIDDKPVKAGGCGCGCGGKCGCESRCCELECLVRPNFFCGQLLTDADLDASIEWARQRFSLSRYRHGWGVVCGLEVTCTHPHGDRDCCPDPQRGLHVYVHPGYAIDCCGNDLVVCEPLCVDLTDICRPADDPCERLPRQAANGEEKRRAGRRQQQREQSRQQQDAAGDAAQREGADDNEYEPVDCWGPLGDDLVAVDLKLRYHEDLAHGQHAMFRSGCSDSGPCEYSRVLERPCVYPERGDPDCDDDDEFELWDKEFTAQRTAAQREIMAALKSPESTLRYLRKHPPYKFCFLEELVCCLLEPRRDADDKRRDPALKRAWEEAYERIGFWLYLDWLLHRLQCGCWSCKPDRGVPIARVLLKRVELRGEQTCRVMLIDTSAPHRRPLHRDGCRPVPRGAVDLAPYLWQSYGHVKARLGEQGVAVDEDEVASERDIVNRLNQSSLLLRDDAGRRLNAWIIRDPFNCKRVVGFGVPNNT